MNGQIYQLCRIVAAAKDALENEKELSFKHIGYENKIEFQFLPRKKLFGKKTYLASNVEEWYAYYVKNGLHDVKLLAPWAVEDRNLLGFSNTTESSILCFSDKGVTYFMPHWEFDSEKSVWNILYTEYEWKNPPSAKPRFKDETANFKRVLIDTKKLALKIKFPSFAKMFQRAIDILEGSADYIDKEYGLPLPAISEEKLRIFEAASAADVFGGMGSWNDSPPYAAHEKNLDEEYERLSSELLRQMRLAILYAINE